MIKKVANAAQLTEIGQKNKKVLVDFFATWCGPCKKIGPVFEKYAEQYKGKMTFAKIDVDEASDAVEQFRIDSMPTFVALKDGKEVKRLQGADEIALLNFIKDLEKL
jgi:thioredoxin